MKILIIDDELAILEMVEGKFRKEGYSTFTAESAEEGMRLFRRVKPDLIVLDVMLPQRSGLDFCKAIRRDSTVPILILSARADESDRIQGLELGADDYMTKPFGVKEIIARIRAILRRAAARESKPDQIDEFTMDDLRIVQSELRAYRGTQEIPLSPRDAKVLRLLFERRGKVVDRNTLADEVWGVDYFPESRALDQHISQLRKRIELDTSRPRIIRTVHGAGYRFDG